MRDPAQIVAYLALVRGTLLAEANLAPDTCHTPEGDALARSQNTSGERATKVQQDLGREIPRRRQAAGIAIVFGLGGALAALWIMSGPHETSAPSTAPLTAEVEATPSSLVPTPLSLTGLALSGPNSITEIDTARLNLLAAQGLPGAENLDVDKALAELDRWAAHVRFETDRHLYRFREHPEEYENSEAYFRMLMFIVVLQADLGVHYNAERIDEPDFTNSKDLFIHGLIDDDNGGTCVSMPVLYVAVGRRLGYPLRLVVTKGHVFARWDDEASGEQFNIEGTNRGLSTPDDEHYRNWPYELSKQERTNDWFLRSLAPAEELAVFLMQRGHCLEDTGRWGEAYEAYGAAHRLAPKSPEAEYFANRKRASR